MRKKQTRHDNERLLKIIAFAAMLSIGLVFFWSISAKAEAVDPRYPHLSEGWNAPQKIKAAKHHRKHARTRVIIDANGGLASGLVHSRKTGATARVAAQYAPQFQAYIDDLESHGAVIRFIGGIRRGKCWSGGLHPCGRAIDVCQLSRGRVDARCHLPGRTSIIAIAARHGLTEGAIWCNSDYGHAQVGQTAGPCGSRLAKHRKHKMAMR